MKKQILTAVAVVASLCGYAQTKGTSALGLGVGVNTNKYEYNTGTGTSVNESRNNSFSLGYGLFIRDNAKLGVDLQYNTSEQKSDATVDSKLKGYGVNVTYQQYYPIVKKLFAYAGGKAAYSYSREKYTLSDVSDRIGNQYTLGAYGGVTWFFSQRFALETSLLSANVVYATSDQKSTQSNNGGYQTKSTAFNLATSGAINNLGFKIYLLF
jgi:hypothetical protein